jgi:hypothetical protein
MHSVAFSSSLRIGIRTDTELDTVDEESLTTRIVKALNKVNTRANPDIVSDSSIKS